MELQKSPLLGMIRFKKRIVVSLAKYGFHEGPLCDCLCYLNEWMLKTNKKEKVDTSSKGNGGTALTVRLLRVSGIHQTLGTHSKE